MSETPGQSRSVHRRPSVARLVRRDLRSGFTSYFDQEASERNAIYDRPLAIDAETKKELESHPKRRASRALVRYLVAICIGVAGTLAWQSYGDETAKQIIATSRYRAGQPQPPAPAPVSKSRPVLEVALAQIAVAPEAPAAPSLDPGQAQPMARELATPRQTVEQLAAGQDQVTREIGKIEAAVTPAPPPPLPIAPARKPMPVPSSSQAPVTPPTSLAPIPPSQNRRAGWEPFQKR